MKLTRCRSTLSVFTLLGSVILLTLLAGCGMNPLQRFGSIDHIYLLVLENRAYADVVGSSQAPFLDSLIAGYGLATSYTAVAHPSEPNYLALFSGSTQGVQDDGVHDIPGTNLADQLEAHGKTWRVYEQNVPTDCFAGETFSGGQDGSGDYARKHNPAISFTNIRTNPSRCANITDMAHFDPVAANFSFIVPNLCNDMHNCSLAEGDTFMQGFLPRILTSSAWKDGGVLFVVWDEGTDNQGGGGKVPLIVVSPRVAAGSRYSNAYNHYSLLRTIEDIWGIECLNESCKAPSLKGALQ